jgi:hypothetical protein
LENLGGDPNAEPASNPAGIYYGTNTGKLFGSADEGDS